MAWEWCEAGVLAHAGGRRHVGICFVMHTDERRLGSTVRGTLGHGCGWRRKAWLTTLVAWLALSGAIHGLLSLLKCRFADSPCRRSLPPYSLALRTSFLPYHRRLFSLAPAVSAAAVSFFLFVFLPSRAFPCSLSLSLQLEICNRLSNPAADHLKSGHREKGAEKENASEIAKM